MSTGTTTHGREEMSCDRIAAESVAERYLLGQLSEHEQAAFEAHYFDCERCFGELKTLEAMRAELRETAVPRALTPRRGWWPVWLGAAAAVVLAAGIAIWLMRPDREIGPTLPTIAGEPVTVPPPSVSPAPAPGPPAVGAPVVSLGELARFTPPPYVPVVLRGPEEEAQRVFRAAMAHYMRGGYDQAIDGLRRAAGLDPSAADARFFLGVCLLLTGQTDPGISALKGTIGLGSTAYLEEAHFYLAKGLLQKGNTSGARQALLNMIKLGGDHQREARQLLNQIERLKQDAPQP